MPEFEFLEQESRLETEDLDYLSGVFLFRGLSSQQLHQVMALARKVNVPKGQVLIQEGDRGDTLYIIRHGEVEVSKSITLPLGPAEQARPEKALTRMGARDRAVFGELSLFEQALRSATVRCLTDCSFYAMGREEFLRFCDSHVEVGYLLFKNLAQMVGERLRRASDDIVKLTTALSIALERR